MARLGIAFSGGPNPAEIVECVKLAEALGYESAVFPKMIVLCGEIADGVILTRSTLRTAAAVRDRLAEGGRRAPAATRPGSHSPRCCPPPWERPAGRRSTFCAQGWRFMPGS